MKKLLGIVLILLIIVSCHDDKQLNPDIAAIPVNIEIDRFDITFSKITPKGLPSLKQTYPYLFSTRYDDAYWEQKIKDTLQKEVEEEVFKVFLDINKTQEDLELLFKHIKYYFPQATVPKTIAVATDVDYRNKVILADSLLFLSLSTYLGEDHHFYGGIPKFYTKNHREEQIDVDVAMAFAKTQTPRPQISTFLEQIVYEGKQLYLMELFLSQKATNEIFSYTPEEYSFVKENEINMWEYFVSSKILFSTDKKLVARFIDPAPFSKFYLEFDNETPGRIGRYMGYKIVASYMSNNDVPLKNMLLLDGETIFNNAKYKP
ncbi:gliding motility lipoprotein GldB [Dokdonia sp.]|uniref:gliding motility lipoprotein GldB n=1 Tax=Dokdonia sp. TaxID=2024995 RepID=UPI0032634EE4